MGSYTTKKSLFSAIINYLCIFGEGKDLKNFINLINASFPKENANVLNFMLVLEG